MTTPPSNLAWLNLPNLPRSVKALFIGYLLVVGLGLCMAGMQIMMTHGHGMLEGKPRISVDDIVYSYYGNRDGSKLEEKLNGSMSDKGTLEIRRDIIKWVRNGSPEAEWNLHFKEVFAQYCVMCHSTMPGIPDFTKFEEVKKAAAVDTGASIQFLTRVSHIHLFGVSFIFFFIGLIFSFAVGVPRWLKMLAILAPFGFLLIDVFSWWLTKWDPNFAWFTIIGGFGYSIASTFMWLTSMYQMLILSRNGKVYGNAWENDL